jgi:hypothetical protein
MTVNSKRRISGRACCNSSNSLVRAAATQGLASPGALTDDWEAPTGIHPSMAVNKGTASDGLVCTFVPLTRAVSDTSCC